MRKGLVKISNNMIMGIIRDLKEEHKRLRSNILELIKSRIKTGEELPLSNFEKGQLFLDCVIDGGEVSNCPALSLYIKGPTLFVTLSGIGGIVNSVSIAAIGTDNLIKIAERLEGMVPVFPNGFGDWVETYFLVCHNITWICDAYDKKAYTGDRVIAERIIKVRSEGSNSALPHMAREITDAFEWEYKGKPWDGEYYDAVDKFFNDYLSKRVQ